MGFSLFPKTVKFEEMFLEQISMAIAATNLLDEMCQQACNFEECCEKITAFERRGDKVSREISSQLDQTFITPIDREDIHEINTAQEQVLDLIKAIAIRIGLYHFEPIPQSAKLLTHNLRIMVEEVAKMLAKLGHEKNVEDNLTTIRDYKKKTDKVLLDTISEMYKPRDVDNREFLNIMRWSRIYDRLERTIYRTYHLASVIQGVFLKNA
ncbi:DUF47 family protein [Desulfarculales bacterium]